MPLELESEDFLPEDLPKVRDFDCGSLPWQVAMSQWIHAPKTYKFGHPSRKTDIWTYWHPDGQLVGFGSLGRTQWRDPSPDGLRTDFTIIPALAIQTKFQGQPTDPSVGVKFSHQILSDLIGRAILLEASFLGLFVHVDNAPAIKLYRRFGFTEFDEPQERHLRMRRRLR